VVVQDLLESDFAVELGVVGDEDGAQAAFGVRPEDAEPLSVGRGRADGIAARAFGVIVVVGRLAALPDRPRFDRTSSEKRGVCRRRCVSSQKLSPPAADDLEPQPQRLDQNAWHCLERRTIG
jgi:hypothetical protein